MACKKAVKVLLEWIGNLVIAGAALLVVFMLVSPRLGLGVHPVLSGSMEPALKVGGVIVTKQVSLKDVKKGDVISYRREGMPITHRVIDITSQDGKISFQTKGDANEDPDPYTVIPKGERVAKTILFLPYFGFLAGLMKNKMNFLFLVGIPAVLLIAWYILDIFREAKNQRKKDRPVQEITVRKGV